MTIARSHIIDPQSKIPQTEVAVAVKVAETIFARGLAGAEGPADLREFVEGQLYKPEDPRHASANLRR